MDDFAASLVHYDEIGGLLPRGPCVGGYSHIMSMCPATPLIVSAYQRDMLTKTDPEKAYQAIVRNHGPDGMWSWRMWGERISDKICFFIENGYVPGNAGETVEGVFQDWTLSQMASKMGKKEDAERYLKRSEGWKKLFHPGQKLLFQKKSDGKWSHVNPLSGAGWVEANSWQGTWGVSHAIGELAELMGGNDLLCDKLDEAFRKSMDQDFISGYGSGYVSYANQPGCSNAHVFNYAGKPWLTQYWMRQVQRRAYGETTPERGYGGHDEDQGQMGGVSVLMSLGLFSLKGACSEKPVYELTSPIFDKIRVKLHPDYCKGNEFIIKVQDNAPENFYIHDAKLNGNHLDRFWIGHEEFSQGGLLEIRLGDKPNEQWGQGVVNKYINTRVQAFSSFTRKLLSFSIEDWDRRNWRNLTWQGFFIHKGGRHENNLHRQTS